LTFAVPLQEVFRTSYHWLVDGAYGDKEVSVGGQIAVRLPAEFASHDWEHFQPESAAAVARWAKHHQRGIVLDVGESSGIDSLVALFSDPQIEVVKLDSDLLRLARIRRLCKLAPGERLRLVYGFIGASCTKVFSLAEAVSSTEAHLRAAARWGGLGMLAYDVRFNPCRVVDFQILHFLFENEFIDRPMLIRLHATIDQISLLRGGLSLLRRARTALLVTIARQGLAPYEHSIVRMQDFLTSIGYNWHCITGDHEQQWWCEFRTPVARPEA